MKRVFDRSASVQTRGNPDIKKNGLFTRFKGLNLMEFQLSKAGKQLHHAREECPGQLSLYSHNHPHGYRGWRRCLPLRRRKVLVEWVAAKKT